MADVSCGGIQKGERISMSSVKEGMEETKKGSKGKTDVSRGEKKETVMYIGPSIKNVVSTGTLYKKRPSGSLEEGDGKAAGNKKPDRPGERPGEGAEAACHTGKCAGGYLRQSQNCLRRSTMERYKHGVYVQEETPVLRSQW